MLVVRCRRRALVFTVINLVTEPPRRQSDVTKGLLPVGSDVPHEEDAGVHIEEECRSPDAAVEHMDGDGRAGVVGDADG